MDWFYEILRAVYGCAGQRLLLFDKGKDTSSGGLRRPTRAATPAGRGRPSARNHSHKEIAMSTTANKQILCGFGIDVDAVAGWLGSYGGQDSPFDISRGLFAGEVGTPRLLRLSCRPLIKHFVQKKGMVLSNR
jgi:hypothetical protein